MSPERKRQPELAFTTEENLDGEPTLPLGDVLHEADEQAEAELEE